VKVPVILPPSHNLLEQLQEEVGKICLLIVVYSDGCRISW